MLTIQNTICCCATSACCSGGSDRFFGRLFPVMPPKKRQRISGGSNQKQQVQPLNAADVAPARLQLKDWIDLVYQGRNGYAETKKFPLNDGGSFLDLVQRVWADEDALVEESCALVKRLGIVDSSSTDDDFMMKYLTMEDRLIKELGQAIR